MNWKHNSRITASVMSASRGVVCVRERDYQSAKSFDAGFRVRLFSVFELRPQVVRAVGVAINHGFDGYVRPEGRSC